MDDAAVQDVLAGKAKRQPFAEGLVSFATSELPCPQVQPAPQSDSAEAPPAQTAVEEASLNVGVRVEILKAMRNALVRQAEGALKKTAVAPNKRPQGAATRDKHRRNRPGTGTTQPGPTRVVNPDFLDQSLYAKIQSIAQAAPGTAASAPVFDAATAQALIFPGLTIPDAALQNPGLCLNLEDEKPPQSLAQHSEVLNEEIHRRLEDLKLSSTSDGTDDTAVLQSTVEVLRRHVEVMREEKGLEVFLASADSSDGNGLLQPVAWTGGREGGSIDGGGSSAMEIDRQERHIKGVMEQSGPEYQQQFEAFEWPTEILVNEDSGAGAGDNESNDGGQRMGVNGTNAARVLPASFKFKRQNVEEEQQGGGVATVLPEQAAQPEQEDLWDQFELEMGNRGMEMEQEVAGNATNMQQQEQVGRRQLPSFRRAAPLAAARAALAVTEATQNMEIDDIEDSDEENVEQQRGQGAGGSGAAAAPAGQLRAVNIRPRQHKPLNLEAVYASNTDGSTTTNTQTAIEEERQPALAQNENTAPPPTLPCPPSLPLLQQPAPPRNLSGPRLTLHWEGPHCDPLVLRPSTLISQWIGTKARWKPVRRVDELLLKLAPPHQLITSNAASSTAEATRAPKLPLITVNAEIFAKNLVFDGVINSSSKAAVDSRLSECSAAATEESVDGWRELAVHMVASGSSEGLQIQPEVDAWDAFLLLDENRDCRDPGGTTESNVLDNTVLPGIPPSHNTVPQSQKQVRVREWWESESEEEEIVDPVPPPPPPQRPSAAEKPKKRVHWQDEVKNEDLEGRKLCRNEFENGTAGSIGVEITFDDDDIVLQAEEESGDLDPVVQRTDTEVNGDADAELVVFEDEEEEGEEGLPEEALQAEAAVAVTVSSVEKERENNQERANDEAHLWDDLDSDASEMDDQMETPHHGTASNGIEVYWEDDEQTDGGGIGDYGGTKDYKGGRVYGGLGVDVILECDDQEEGQGFEELEQPVNSEDLLGEGVDGADGSMLVDIEFDDGEGEIDAGWDAYLDVEGGEEEGGEGMQGGGALMQVRDGRERVWHQALEAWKAQQRAAMVGVRLLRMTITEILGCLQQQQTSSANSSGMRQSVLLSVLRKKAAEAVGSAPSFQETLSVVLSIVHGANIAVVAQAQGSNGVSSREGEAAAVQCEVKGPIMLKAVKNNTDVEISW